MKCDEYNQYNENGLPEGVWRDYYDVSKQKVFTELNFCNGVAHGLAKAYHKNGSVQLISLLYEEIREGEMLAYDYGE